MKFSYLFLLPLGCFLLLFTSLMIMPFELFYFYIAPIVGLSFLVVGSWLIPFWWFKRIPEPARLLTEAKGKGLPPLYVVHDSGRGQFTLIEEKLGEGIVITKEGKWKILPQIAAIQNPSETEDQKYIYDYRDWVSKRSICVGLDMPIWYGYSGIACLLNPLALALYEAGEMKVQMSDGSYRFNPKGKKGKKIEDALQPLLFLELRKIRNIIGKQFSTTQTLAALTESERIGLLGRFGFGKYVLPIAILIMIVIGAIMFFLFAPTLINMMSGATAGAGV